MLRHLDVAHSSNMFRTFFWLRRTLLRRLGRIPREQRRHTTILCPAQTSTPAPGFGADMIASPILRTGGVTAGRDKTFAGNSNTLPARKLKHQRQKRPQSGGMLPASFNKRAEEMNCLMAETDQCERLQSSFRQDGTLEKSFVVNANFLDNGVRPFQEDPVTRQLNSSIYLDHSYSNNPEVSQYLGASIKSLPESSQPPEKPDQRADLFKSMPGIPNTTEDYGIYGDTDELDETMYSAASNAESLSPKAQMLGMNCRSKSHGDMLQDGSESPSQQQIALSLAKSLTDERLNEPDIDQLVAAKPPMGPSFNPNGPSWPQRSTSAKASQLPQRTVNPQPHGQDTKIASRPKSAVSRLPVAADPRKERPKSAVFPNAVKPRMGGDSIWGNDSFVNDTLTNSPGLNSTVGGASLDRRSKKKKKKDKEEKVLDNLNVTTLDGQKKKGFRDSLKQIFFKRR